MNKNTVIYHSADYDGLFCREIARKFLPADTQFHGWDFGDPLICLDRFEGNCYVIDLSPDCLKSPYWEGKNIIWIDHHKSSIEKWPKDIPGYRIDGVAACRLAWQWFSLHAEWDPREQHPPYDLPNKLDFVDRCVIEPLSVRLAGEYDIWDKRDSRADLFQYGLDTEIDQNPKMFPWLFDMQSDAYVNQIVAQGKCAHTCIAKRDADMMKSRSFLAKFEGLKFLCLNVARCNSLSFAAKDVPETGHDALMGFYWNGKEWAVSLYHAKHNTSIDLSLIAVKYGGGGHRGACGFRVGNLPGVSELPFISA